MRGGHIRPCHTPGYLSTFGCIMLSTVLMVSYKIEWQTKNVDEGYSCLGGWIYINLLLVKITIEYAMNLLFLG